MEDANIIQSRKLKDEQRREGGMERESQKETKNMNP